MYLQMRVNSSYIPDYMKESESIAIENSENYGKNKENYGRRKKVKEISQ